METYKDKGGFGVFGGGTGGGKIHNKTNDIE